MENLLYSRAPVIGRGKTKLMRLADLSGAGKLEWVSFEQSLVRLLEAKATIRLMHDGVEVKEVQAYSDYYGYLCALEGALEDVVQVCERYRVTPASSLIATVDLEVVEIARLPASPNAQSLGNCPVYEYVPRNAGWLIHDEAILEQLKGVRTLDERIAVLEQAQPVNREKVVLARQGIWRSDRDLGHEGMPPGIAQLIADLRKEAEQAAA